MKSLFCLLLLLLTGCSSTHWLNQSTSKSKFYEDFNKSVANKNLEVTLENDSTFIAKDGAKIINDTLFINTNYGENDISFLPITNVKKISYKNHWLGVPIGFLGGVIIGVGIGGWISHYDSQHMGDVDMKNLAYLTPLYYGLTLGPVGGSVLGWFIGWNYTYQFNP